MQNRKKMRILSSICAIMMLAGNALNVSFANVVEEKYSLDFGTVNFAGKTDCVGSRVTYTVKDNAGVFFDVGEFDADSDGNFELSFALKDSGDYILYIKDSSDYIFEKQIEYVNSKDREQYLLNIFNQGDKKEIESAFDEIKPVFEDEGWADMDDELKEWICIAIEEIGDFESIEDVRDEFDTQNMLYRINTAKATGIVSVIKDYGKELGIAEEDAVSDFIGSSTDAKKKALVQLLADNPAFDTKTLLEMIEESNEAKDSSGSSGGGGSKGSGNKTGASSAGNKTVVGTININDKKENEEVKTVVKFNDLTYFTWAEEAILSLAEKGVVSGDGNGSFRPGANVTREEFVKMVVEAFDIPHTGNEVCHFIDVFEYDWFYSYVAVANECGIVNGMSDDFFGIHKNITRQDAAVILKRAADFTGMELSSVRDYIGFNDEANFSQYSKEAIIELYKCGVINGVGDKLFKPFDSCTRAEAAKMIYGII